MREIYRPPTILFPECIASDMRLRLQGVLQEAIRGAAGGVAEGDEAVLGAGGGTPHPARERFSRERYDAEKGEYAVPSYRDAGAPSALPLREGSAGTIGAAAARREQPRGSVSGDLVVDGRSFLRGQQVALFPGGSAMRVEGERYAVSSGLRRALAWGRLLFGAHSYAILEGAVGGDSRYFSVRTTHPPRRSTSTMTSGKALGEGEVRGIKEPIAWQSHLYDERRNAYLLRGVVVGDGEVMWPPNRALVEEFYSELETGDPQEGRVPDALARPLIFGEVDRLLAVGKINEALATLVVLDATAFILLDGERKMKYLEVLADARAREAGDRAILEILKTMERPGEHEGALALLRRKRSGAATGR